MMLSKASRIQVVACLITVTLRHQFRILASCVGLSYPFGLLLGVASELDLLFRERLKLLLQLGDLNVALFDLFLELSEY
jgi:hypothetical protein